MTHVAHLRLSRKGRSQRQTEREHGLERKSELPGADGPVPVTEVGFRSSGENWNEYLLDDGTVFRIKLVVTDIYRVDGAYDDQGNPQYVAKSTNVAAVSASDDMRRKP